MSKVGKNIAKSVTTENILVDGENSTITNSSGDLTINPGSGQKLVVQEQIEIDNINIDGNTISSTDVDGNINLTPNGTGEVVAGGAVNVDNVKIDGNTISSTDTDGDINLTPDGTGEVVVSGNLNLATSALTVGGQLNVDNITISGNTISSTDTDGQINITPDGTGAISINGTVTMDNNADTISFNTTGAVIEVASGNLSLTSSSGNVVIAGTKVQIDNLELDGNAITATDTNGNITLTAEGTGEVVSTSTILADNIRVGANFVTNTSINGSLNLQANGTGSVVIAGTADLNITSGVINLNQTANSISAASGDITIDASTNDIVLESTTLIVEQSTPATGPTVPSGYGSFYPGDDGKPYFKNDAGSAIELGEASSFVNPMDSEGDIIYGGTSGVATKLDAGTSGQVLTSNGASAPSWEDSTQTSGTYTATMTASPNNIAATTHGNGIYSRVGDTVTVSVTHAVNTTASGSTFSRFEVTLPIASNFTDTKDLAGVFTTSTTNESGFVQGSVANDTAQITWDSNNAGVKTRFYTFQYRVK